MAPRITVRPAALAALADELAGLAVALAADGQACRGVAGVLDAALGGREGAATSAVAVRWSVLAAGLADGAGAAADVLRAAAAAYRGADEALAARIGGR
jgi:uncharacterized protein YukE